MLRQRAEGMNGSGINDMPRTVSPDRSKMEGTVFKIMALEQEIQETQREYDALLADMEARIKAVSKAVDDADYRDLLSKRYLEFKSWNMIAADFGYSVQHIYRLRDKAIQKLRADESS